MTLAAVGRDRRSPTADLTDDYIARAGRLAPSLGMAGPDLVTVEAGRARSAAERQRAEAEALAAAIPGGAARFILDERGRHLSSRELSALFETLRDAGEVGAIFLIGGADGFGGHADSGPLLPIRRRIAFGRATWPHLLVRTMMAEQVYRAFTLLAGHPYHRD